MCCLNWMDCFGFLFIFIISLGIYSTRFLSFTSCTIKDVSQIIIFVLISQTLLIDSLQCVFSAHETQRKPHKYGPHFIVFKSFVILKHFVHEWEYYEQAELYKCYFNDICSQFAV